MGRSFPSTESLLGCRRCCWLAAVPEAPSAVSPRFRVHRGQTACFPPPLPVSRMHPARLLLVLVLVLVLVLHLLSCHPSVGPRQVPRVRTAGHGDARRAPRQLQARRRHRPAHAQGARRDINWRESKTRTGTLKPKERTGLRLVLYFEKNRDEKYSKQ